MIYRSFLPVLPVWLSVAPAALRFLPIACAVWAFAGVAALCYYAIEAPCKSHYTAFAERLHYSLFGYCSPLSSAGASAGSAINPKSRSFSMILSICAFRSSCVIIIYPFSLLTNCRRCDIIHLNAAFAVFSGSSVLISLSGVRHRSFFCFFVSVPAWCCQSLHSVSMVSALCKER